MKPKSRNQILFVLFIGVLMGALDIAIIGPALPAIRTQFNISERTLSWMFSLYVLFNLVGTPLMAKLSDLYGRRMIYILDVGLFALGSLLVALSPDFTLVLIGRAVQGFGAGGIFPVASAVIGDTFPPEKRGGALGLIGAVFGLAFLVGPLLGALMIAFAVWQWLFFINLPIALLVMVLSWQTLPTRQSTPQKPFDWQGMLLLSVMLTSLAWALNHLDAADFFGRLASLDVWPFFLIFAGLLWVLLKVEKRVQSPIIAPELFSRKQLRLAYIISAGAGFGEASLVYMPLLAVAALSATGITNKNASWLLMPVVLAMVIGSPTAGRMLDRFGSRAVILAGTSVMTVGMLMLSLFSSSLALFIVSGVLIGLGMSALLGAPLRYIMLNEASAAERSVGQGVVAIFTSAGQLMGSALVGAIAASHPISGSDASGYNLAFLVIACMGALLALLSWTLKNQQQEALTVQTNQNTALEASQN